MTNTQETINTILIDVLKGVKETGSELYAAGKAGVAQAVDFAFDAIVPIFFGTVFTVIALIFLLRNIKNDIQTIAKIKLAPRVYIIEYVTKK